MQTLKRYLPLTAALLILAILAAITPWHAVWPLVAHASLANLGVLALLGACYYLVKSLRFWVMLRLLGVEQPLVPVAFLYLCAQPMTILPGGELYRTMVLERYRHVPKAKSAPTVTLQGLIEAVVLVSFALIGALALRRDRLLALAIALIVGLVVVALARGWLAGGHKLLNRLPLVNVSAHRYNRFVRDHQRLLAPKAVAIVGGLSVVPVALGILVVYTAAHAIGVPLSLANASISYTLPVILAGLSLLPGGAGATEGSSVGILTLVGIAAPAAVAITLLTRVFTLGLGIAIGAVATAVLYLKRDYS